MEITIDVNIIWQKKDTNPIYFSNGRISVTNNQITVISIMSSSDADAFSLSHPAAINLHSDLEDFISYSEAKIDGKPVTLKTKGAHVLTVRFRHLRGSKVEVSWQLSYLSFLFKSEQKANSYLLDIPFIHLTDKLGGINEFPKEVIVENDNYKFHFSQVEDPHLTILQIDPCPSIIIEDLLMHMTFYFNTLVNVYRKSICKSEKEEITVNIPTFTLEKESLRHPELQFISIGKPNTFSTFLQNSQWPMLDKDRQMVIKQAVYTFARCRYCDDTTQFLLLYSILDRYAGNTYGSKAYASMKEGLEKRNISISKIGPATDKDLQGLHLQLIHDNGDVVDVTNFCNLRNYIMHFMATPQIDDYLKRNDLVSNLRFAVTTILLQEFGFSDFSFHKGWEHLSVSIKEQKEKQD